MQIVQKRFVNCFVHQHVTGLKTSNGYIPGRGTSSRPASLYIWLGYKQLTSIIHALYSQIDKFTAKIQACFLALLLCIWS